jgi:ketosteroid isomerase-like protein
MSQENIEVVRRMLEAWRRGEGRAALDALAPDVEWDATESTVPGLAGIYRGHAGVAEFWRQWLDAWETIDVVRYELLDAPDKVILLLDQRMRGRYSAIDTAVFKYAQVFTVRDRKVVHWKVYEDQDKALEAAGLRE